MEHSEGVDGGPQTVCAGCQIGDVGLDCERPARPGDGGDLLRHRVETGHDRGGQHQARALFCEAEAHRAAKAAVGAGHDDDTTLKIDVGQVHFAIVFPL